MVENNKIQNNPDGFDSSGFPDKRIRLFTEFVYGDDVMWYKLTHLYQIIVVTIYFLKFKSLGIQFSQIELLSLSTIKKIYTSVKSIFQKFPQLNGSLVSFSVISLDARTIACTNYKIFKEKPLYMIDLNKALWTSDKLESILYKVYKSKFSSTGTIEGTILHEVAHVLNGIIIFNRNKSISEFGLDWTLNKTLNEVFCQNNILTQNLYSISDYACTDSGEAFAEAFSAYYSNIRSELINKILKRVLVLL